MSLQEQIANAIAASFSYAYEGDPDPIIVGERRARRAADAVTSLLLGLAQTMWWDGRRIKVLPLAVLEEGTP